MSDGPEILVLGWGNPGRRDDGLGPALIDALRELDLPGVVLDSNYQLQIEDAARIAGFERVVFADADLKIEQPFRFEPIAPTVGALSFTTHHVAPESLLALCRDLFQKEPQAWVLGIRGHVFDEFGEGLTAEAHSNLDQAVEFLVSVIRRGSWRDPVPRPSQSPIVHTQEGEPCLNQSR